MGVIFWVAVIVIPGGDDNNLAPVRAVPMPVQMPLPMPMPVEPFFVDDAVPMPFPTVTPEPPPTP